VNFGKYFKIKYVVQVQANRTTNGGL